MSLWGEQSHKQPRAPLFCLTRSGNAWVKLGHRRQLRSSACRRVKQLTAAFWMICFEQNTVIRENLRAAEQITELGHSQPAALPGRAESPPENGCGPVRGGSSAPSPPIISLGLLDSSGKLGNLEGQTLLLFSHGERSMWGRTRAEFADDPGEDVQPGPWGHHRDARGESVLRNNGYVPAASNAYKLFRSLYAALKSDLHKSFECLTEFVNAPALLGTMVRSAGARNAAGNQPQTKMGLSGASGRACCPHAVPKLFFQSQMDPCGLFINCQKLQEMSGYQ